MLLSLVKRIKKCLTQRKKQMQHLPKQKNLWQIKTLSLLMLSVLVTSGCSSTSPPRLDVPPLEIQKREPNLDRSTSEALVSITGDGDQAIIELNACVDQYTKMREIIRGKR